MEEKITISYGVKCIRNWNELIDFYYKEDNGKFSQLNDKSTPWIFRGDKREKKYYEDHGMPECDKCKETNIIRCLCQKKKFMTMEIDDSDFKTPIEKAFEWYSIDVNDRCSQEKRIIRRFQRKLHHYTQHIPEKDDTLEWLALMRHYKAPTRLLDWTYSFFTAVYFAINELDYEKEAGEVWILNAKWFSDKTDKILKRKYAFYELISKEAKPEEDYKCELSKNRSRIVQGLMDEPKPSSLVYNVTPFRLNERLMMQQGTFLVPGNIKIPFVENLRIQEYQTSELQLYKIIINVCCEQRNTILRCLNEMNINQAVLFPDLEGFAKSLTTRMIFPKLPKEITSSGIFEG